MINYYNPQPQYFDNNGAVLSLGTLSFYESGTTTFKPIYSSSEIAISNPTTLDTSGRIVEDGILLGEGAYKVVLKDASGDEIWTKDPVYGATSFDTINSSAVVETISDLRDMTVGDYDSIYVLGYYTAYDGGGGWFNYSSALATADNGGTIISPNGSPATGRWLRAFEGSIVYPIMFGCVPDDTSKTLDSNFTSMIDWCKLNLEYRTIHLTAGVYNVNGTITFNGDLLLIIEEDAQFGGDSISGTITLSCDLQIKSRTQLVTTDMTLDITSHVPEAIPDWWGIQLATVVKDNNLMDSAVATGSPVRLIRSYTITEVKTVSGGVNYSDTKFIFESGSSWNNTNGGTEGVTTIGELVLEVNDATVIEGNRFYNLVSNTQKLRLNWWKGLSSLIVQSEWDNLTTWGLNSPFKTVVMDTGTGYGYAEDLDNIDRTQLNYEFVSPTSIASTGAFVLDIGTIKADYPALLTFSSGSLWCANGFNDLRWFGAVANDDDGSSAPTALENACKASKSGIGKQIIIDGLDNQFNMEDASTATFTINKYGMVLRNLYLKGIQSFAGTTLIDFTITGGNITFENCVFEDGKVIVNSDSQVEFNDCKFIGDTSHTTNDFLDVDAHEVIFTNNEAPYVDDVARDMLITSDYLIFTDNNLNATALTITDDTGTVSYSSLVTNNKFTGSTVAITEKGRISVVNNLFIKSGSMPEPSLDFTNSTVLANGIIVKNNQFSATSGYTAVPLTIDTATTGNVECVVVDNPCQGQTNPSTKLSSSFTIDGGDVTNQGVGVYSWTKTVTNDYSNGAFPLAVTPLRVDLEITNATSGAVGFTANIESMSGNDITYTGTFYVPSAIIDISLVTIKQLFTINEIRG